MDLESETYAIIGAAMEVHSCLGKGYLEAVYQEAMVLEMTDRGIPFVGQPKMRIDYKGHTLSKFYVPDFLAFDLIPIELKAHSEPLSKADMKQILNALRTCGGSIGLIFNYGRASLDYRRVMLSASLSESH